ncbi:hypothetical protein CPC08DRAFT_709165 [Agrocybe pediades]|nr:hypothetical protein CPC08DRAFT_709165 [Agrocybe pediades]
MIITATIRKIVKEKRIVWMRTPLISLMLKEGIAHSPSVLILANMLYELIVIRDVDKADLAVVAFS